MATKTVKIFYGPDETGLAEVLHGRVARIAGHVMLGRELWRDDIVLLDSLSGEPFPRVERVLYGRFPCQTTIYFYLDSDAERLLSVLSLAGAEAFVAAPAADHLLG